MLTVTRDKHEEDPNLVDMTKRSVEDSFTGAVAHECLRPLTTCEILGAVYLL